MDTLLFRRSAQTLDGADVTTSGRHDEVTRTHARRFSTTTRNDTHAASGAEQSSQGTIRCSIFSPTKQAAASAGSRVRGRSVGEEEEEEAW